MHEALGEFLGLWLMPYLRHGRFAEPHLRQNPPLRAQAVSAGWRGGLVTRESDDEIPHELVSAHTAPPPKPYETISPMLWLGSRS